MEPEEIDKLFNKRLGKVAPTPPDDLWNRLQDRLDAEMPSQKPEEKRRLGWMYYSVAAAITLLLAVGVMLRYQQPLTLNNPTIAKTDSFKPTIEPLQTITPTIDLIPDQTIASVTKQEKITAPVTVEHIIVENAKKSETIKSVASSKSRQKAEERWMKVDPDQQAASNTMLASQTKSEHQPEIESVQTPVSFAATNSAAPVEIVIKRAVNREPATLAVDDESDDVSSFEKKQRLARNIFKQAKNLSNGKQVNLNELGINTDQIALQTSIGKQKISKVINL